MELLLWKFLKNTNLALNNLKQIQFLVISQKYKISSLQPNFYPRNCVKIFQILQSFWLCLSGWKKTFRLLVLLQIKQQNKSRPSCNEAIHWIHKVREIEKNTNCIRE